jgi:hypothetical protein
VEIDWTEVASEEDMDAVCNSVFFIDYVAVFLGILSSMKTIIVKY